MKNNEVYLEEWKMKHSSFKKALAGILSLIITLSLPLTAAAAADEESPLIYVSGMQESYIYENPNTVNAEVAFSMDSKAFLSSATRIFMGFVIASFENVKTAVPNVITGINEIMSPIACDEQGNSKNSNLGAWSFTGPVSNYTEDEINTDTVKAISEAAKSYTDSDSVFVFTYDWRLDTTVNAGRLRDYIDSVLALTGAEKATLVAGAYGGVVANAYLYKYAQHAEDNVASCVFLNAPILGNALIGDIMKGTLAKTIADESSLIGIIQTINGEDRGNALFDYVSDDPTGLIAQIFSSSLGESDYTQFVGSLFKLIAIEILKSQDVHKTVGKAYNEFALIADSTVYESCLREYLRNIPGLWALVPEESYNDALGFMFGDEIINAQLLAKIENCRAVMDNSEDTLRNAQANGINISVVANYGIQLLPATVSLNDLSDGIESVKYASAGALTVDCSKDWDGRNNCVNPYHSHRSPDNDIDAASCILPENTWFIKDLKHVDFSSDAAAQFVIWLAYSGGQRNVWQSTEYPQYLKYNKYNGGSLAPYTNNSDSDGGDYILGDLDMSGDITAADARLALRYVVNLDKPSKMMRIVCDVDGDGKLSAADSRLILRYAVDLITIFPADK